MSRKRFDPDLAAKVMAGWRICAMCKDYGHPWGPGLVTVDCA